MVMPFAASPVLRQVDRPADCSAVIFSCVITSGACGTTGTAAGAGARTSSVTPLGAVGAWDEGADFWLRSSCSPQPATAISRPAIPAPIIAWRLNIVNSFCVSEERAGSRPVPRTLPFLGALRVLGVPIRPSRLSITGTKTEQFACRDDAAAVTRLERSDNLESEMNDGPLAAMLAELDAELARRLGLCGSLQQVLDRVEAQAAGDGLAAAAPLPLRFPRCATPEDSHG